MGESLGLSDPLVVGQELLRAGTMCVALQQGPKFDMRVFLSSCRGVDWVGRTKLIFTKVSAHSHD